MQWLILCAPVWLSPSFFKKSWAPPKRSDNRGSGVRGVGRPKLSQGLPEFGQKCFIRFDGFKGIGNFRQARQQYFRYKAPAVRAKKTVGGQYLILIGRLCKCHVYFYIIVLVQ